MALCQLIVLFSLASAVSAGNNDCKSKQYIEIHSTGIIQCSFQEGFFGVIWYNSTDLFHDEAILTMKDSVKDGEGFSSGKLDIYPNGSLIIKDVSIEDEGNYTVIKLETLQEKDKPYVISVSVIGYPSSHQPVIDTCGNTMDICFQILDEHADLSCSLTDARPAIPLTWLVRTVNGDKNTSSHLSTTSESNVLFTSRVTTTNPFIYSPLLTLFVCKASTAILADNESLVLVQTRDETLMTFQPKRTLLEVGSLLELNCTDSQISFLVWQIKAIPDISFTNVLWAVFHDEIETNNRDEEYNLGNTSSLVVNDIRIDHEGAYRCISGNGFDDNVIVYNVVVFVSPSPAYIVVDGCPVEQYCVLEMPPEGTVVCALSRIRPQVELDLRGISDLLSTTITFFNKQLTIKSNGDMFDVYLTSQYRFMGEGGTRLTIECKVIETDIKQFHLSTKFDMLFLYGSEKTTEQGSPSQEKYYWIILGVLLAVLCLVVLCGLLIIKVKRRKRADTMIPHEVVPMMPQSDPPTYEQMFISELKVKYQDLYLAIQPIPYIRDRLYCVDKVFVEGGIEYMVEMVANKTIWRKFPSYNNILNDYRVKSTRRILEGEPGYGKSTLLLQLAYDWCNKMPNSHLKNVDILIILRLRQLGGVNSIYRAIKQFLLPKDSALTEDDIQDVLRKSSSVVVLLDGYDEYPDQDKDIDSDVMSIIKNKMFQQINVIVTTRSLYLPKGCPALTKRLRLTGFDDTARYQYIRKAVVDEDTDAAEKINERLKENPVLRDLCQAPLFFVMFAHMSHENESFQNFKSVTSFFRYMVSCFHSHMRNKMKDENVKKCDLFEKNHNQLDQLAFEALNCASPKIVWTKEEMCERLGNQFYEQYVRIGILIEEEILDITDILGIIRYKTEVRFYHKLFCEWYAAYHLSDYAAKAGVTFDPWTESDQPKGSVCGEDTLVDDHLTHHQRHIDSQKSNFFKYIDPFDLQYLYRFACGINPAAAEKIIKYLKSRKDALKFAVLCILEKSGKVEDVLYDVEDLCSTAVYIQNDDSFLLQRSTIQLLDIAATNKISVSSVYLSACYNSVDLARDSIQLKSGLYLPSLSILKKLEIWEASREMTSEDVKSIFQYASICSEITELHFIDCLLPQNVVVAPLSALRSRIVEVTWYAPIGDYCLNLESKTWKHKQSEEGETMTDEDYQREVRAFRSGIKQ